MKVTVTERRKRQTVAAGRSSWKHAAGIITKRRLAASQKSPLQLGGYSGSVLFILATSLFLFCPLDADQGDTL
ncbi:hypothetical protein RvY_19073 [Ramazzottius varieornatus]|uniref:Uncharacterized protein n=1 Tax=Ramazzottius varieornatus TaxID=947166 RepID=A0A1D1W853_RAMVA|nr:hypothetical protein RvY_19073 [Ramazzottius varieornatus]